MEKLKKLRSLCQLDVDAIGTYDAALARVDVPILQEKLNEFRNDHIRHVMHLNELIRKLGGEEIADKPDVKGAVLKGFTAITSAMGNEAALMAMIGNEELTNLSYKAALETEWNPEERAMIERHYADEKRHLAWIMTAAKERPWAHQGAGAHP